MCPELDRDGPPEEGAEAPKRPVWKRALSASEGKVLLAGVAFTVLCLGFVGLRIARWLWPEAEKDG